MQTMQTYTSPTKPNHVLIFALTQMQSFRTLGQLFKFYLPQYSIVPWGGGGDKREEIREENAVNSGHFVLHDAQGQCLHSTQTIIFV